MNEYLNEGQSLFPDTAAQAMSGAQVLIDEAIKYLQVIENSRVFPITERSKAHKALALKALADLSAKLKEV